MPTRRAQIHWEGGLKAGKGRFEGSSGAFAAPYSAGTRFAEEPGTNPEELLAAAHGACFSMALAAALEQEGVVAERIDTDAACTIELQGEGYRITRVELQVRVRAPGLDAGTLERQAAITKEACPVSRALLGNLEIAVRATLA